MQKDIKNLIENDIEIDGSGVWVLAENKTFPYTEGPSSENYLKKVFSSANDLSSDSYELEGWIKDWPSEYHLSRKRSQLLRGFLFDSSKRVLEVGCGCGAITRYLGETFNSVVAVEGSLTRARLARLRTSDLNNVSIICAPFQTVKFKERFDIIFCIGVFEYSNMFVDSPNPFDFILSYFRDLLTPNGVVFIAIENQFGLKYFSSAKEDHNSIMFDGLEGYPRYRNRERTFGYNELKNFLNKYFANVNFYFPYPDYKTPSCILSEHLLGIVNVAQLIGNFKQSSYMEKRRPFFDERLTLLELDRNNMLPFFSNSFLIIAGNNSIIPSELKHLGVVYSNNRTKNFQTVTSFIKQDSGHIQVDKKPANGENSIKSDFLTLNGCQGEWIDGLSIHTQIMRRVKERDITIGELFAPIKLWYEHLKSNAYCDIDGYFIEGKYVDCIFSNSFITNGECRFIDREFEWNKKINLNVLFIRSLYDFLNDISNMTDLNKNLKNSSMRLLIKIIAESIGIKIVKNDFKEFCELESVIGHVVYGQNINFCWFRINVILWNKAFFSFISSGFTAIITLLHRTISKCQNVVTRLR